MTISSHASTGAGQITAVGAVYDLIWKLALPPFLESEPLDELVVRGVLMALASYVDHRQLKTGNCTVWPSDELVAAQIGRSEKTVARVLDYLLRVELLVLVRSELRPGRNRQGRPPIYSLPIRIWQHWPQRAIRRNGSDTGVQSIRTQTSVSHGSDTGDQKAGGSDTGVHDEAMDQTPVSTEPGHTGNPAKTMNRANEPEHARARACDPEMVAGGLSTQPTLRGFGAMSVVPTNGSAPGQSSGGAARLDPVMTLESCWPCPDCHQLVFEDGRGHAGGLNRCRNAGRGGHVEQCTSCREWIPSINPRPWHDTKCPVYRELVAQTPIADVTADVEETPQMSERERDRLKREQDLAETARIEADLKRQSTADERIRARATARGLRNQAAV